MDIQEKRGGLMCVVGARPNFMKIAPIFQALRQHLPDLPLALVHTGQHYDEAMSRQYFEALGIPRPDLDLEVGPGSHARQTARIMERFEDALQQYAPRALLVVGDVNSTLACALVAAKEQVPVFHVEAGLRSFDRAMPEEINRILTDRISTLLFTTEPSGRVNLLREGIDPQAIHDVGNVMIDTLHFQLPRAVPVEKLVGAVTCEGLGIRPRHYLVLTLHRPSNVDDPKVLARLIDTIAQASLYLPVIFPVHPRTAAVLSHAGLYARLIHKRVVRLPPVGYLEMLGLQRDAAAVLTDSGGVQEESTALGVPCLTLRDSTERPVTVEQGTNTIVGNEPHRILAALEEVLSGRGKAGRVPPLWDGRAAVRIVDTVKDWMQEHA